MADFIRIEVQGLRGAAGRFQKGAEEGFAGARLEAMNYANRFKDALHDELPDKRDYGPDDPRSDEGALKDQLEVVDLGAEGQWFARLAVQPNTARGREVLARLVHGTPHNSPGGRIYPINASKLRFWDSRAGNYVFPRSVKGFQPRPYLTNAERRADAPEALRRMVVRLRVSLLQAFSQGVA